MMPYRLEQGEAGRGLLEQAWWQLPRIRRVETIDALPTRCACGGLLLIQTPTGRDCQACGRSYHAMDLLAAL